jgi:uncharacterized protein
LGIDLYMLSRDKEVEYIKTSLTYFPVVAILGARQVGKTTISKSLETSVNRKTIYFDLESFEDLNKIKLNTEYLLDFCKDHLVIIDEVQVFPELFSLIRSLVDRHRINGRFLLLGSASPRLITGISESLTGRIDYTTLSPLTLNEVKYENLVEHWVRGGMPEVFLSDDEGFRTRWLESYINTYCTRDLALIFDKVINPQIAYRIWTMISANPAQQVNVADYARSLGVSSNTVSRYIDFLEGAFLVNKLLPWYTNVGKRLAKQPKLYLNDSGILHHLNGINSYETLLNHRIMGYSWESYVINQIKSVVKEKVHLYYYRTHQGTEIDLLLVKNSKPIAAIEIKHSNSPIVSKGFYIGINDVKTSNNYVLTQTSEKYPIKDAWVMSLSTFLKEELEIITR